MTTSRPLTDRLRHALSELRGPPTPSSGLKYTWTNRWHNGHFICGQIEIWPASDYSDPEVIGLPLVGAVGAGSTLQFANQDHSTYVTLPRNFLGRTHRTRAYQVQGDSMSPFIEAGDLALVEDLLSPFELRDNDVILVRRGDEISLRALQRRKGQDFGEPFGYAQDRLSRAVWLAPFNPTKPPEPFQPPWMEILGKMVALMPRTSWHLGVITVSPEMR